MCICGINLKKYILFRKYYFSAILVAFSVQVTLQFCFTIFYSTALNKIVIKLIKLRKQNVKLEYPEKIDQLVIK